MLNPLLPRGHLSRSSLPNPEIKHLPLQDVPSNMRHSIVDEGIRHENNKHGRYYSFSERKTNPARIRPSITELQYGSLNSSIRPFNMAQNISAQPMNNSIALPVRPIKPILPYNPPREGMPIIPINSKMRLSDLLNFPNNLGIIPSGKIPHWNRDNNILPFSSNLHHIGILFFTICQVTRTGQKLYK